MTKEKHYVQNDSLKRKIDMTNRLHKKIEKKENQKILQSAMFEEPNEPPNWNIEITPEDEIMIENFYKRQEKFKEFKQDYQKEFADILKSNETIEELILKNKKVDN